MFCYWRAGVGEGGDSRTEGRGDRERVVGISCWLAGGGRESRLAAYFAAIGKWERVGERRGEIERR